MQRLNYQRWRRRYSLSLADLFTLRLDPAQSSEAPLLEPLIIFYSKLCAKTFEARLARDQTLKERSSSRRAIFPVSITWLPSTGILGTKLKLV